VQLEVKRNKAMRCMDANASKAAADAQREMQSVESALLDFSSASDEQSFARELAVVRNREEALQMALSMQTIASLARLTREGPTLH